MHTLGKIIVSVGLFLGSLFGYQQPAQAPTLGNSFTPVQASNFVLAGSGITSSATTITLTSFKLPDPNRTPITMAMFGDTGYGVLEPQTSKIENISFTGVTQNSNGTATLTGVSRGLSFYTPYNASTTLALSHSGGAYFILTNSGAFYGKEFLFANNTGTSTQQVTIASTSPWRYDSVAQQAAGTYIATTSEFASIAYVQAVTTSGCSNSTETVRGCVELSTTAEAAAGTSLGATGARLVPPNSMHTSTPSANILIPVTSALGKLDQGFLDIFTTNNTWTGTQLFSGSTTQASSTISVLNIGRINATTTASNTASSTITNLIINNNASTTDMFVSGTCYGCNVSYTASSTNFVVGSGSVVYTGAIPSASNLGLGFFKIDGSSDLYGTLNIARTGLTSAFMRISVSGGDTCDYTASWSGANLTVTENSDCTSQVTGTIYWYK